MEKMNKFVSLLLVFSLLLPYVPTPAYALTMIEQQADGGGGGGGGGNLPGAEETEEPQNPPGTPPGVQCTQMGQKPATNGVCCVGLELNSAGKCDEMTFSDPALKSCTSDSQCSGGTGCYPQSASDLFSPSSPSNENEDDLAEAAKSVQAQVGEVETILSNGASCEHSKQCSSYSCVAGTCKEALVCRFAKEGEIAPGAIKCTPGFIKGAGSKCEKDPDAANSVYLGLLKEPTIEDEGQCRFELDEETRKRAIIAMSSLRAMEFMFATSNMTENEDCFSFTPVLKDAIGKPFYETRKNILTNFTDVLNGIEYDFKQLIEAKEKGTKTINIHSGVDTSSGDVKLMQEGETISEADLATRQTSGYDNLIMMYRRNLLFQSYETSMLNTVETANVTLSKLAQGMNTWQSGSKSWDLMGQQLSYKCEASRYKVRPFIKWKTKYYENVADRWAYHWEVTGNAAGNADIIRRDNVKKNLALFSGISEEQAVLDYTKKFYMIDPLMFSGMKQGSYGSGKALKKKGGFLGLPIFGGFKDLRKAYYIPGSGTGSFTYMYNQLKPKLREFYKNLKTNPNQKNFIYEPELVTTYAKSCLEDSKTEQCVDFEKFLEDTLDESFAQFLSYGHSTKDSYSNYFESASSARRRLFAKLEVDMANIREYYKLVIEQRDKQNACIEKVVGGIIDSGILVTDDGGLTEGGSVKPGGQTSGSGAGGKVSVLNKGLGAAKLGPLRLSPLTRSKFSFDLSGNTLRKLNDVANLDGIGTGSVSSNRAGIGSSEQAFLSARKDAMKNANSKAAAKGVNVAKKEKAIKDIMNSMRKTARGGSGSSGSGSGSSRGGFGGDINAGSAALGKDLKGAGEMGDGQVGTGEGVKGDKVGDGSAGQAAAGAGNGLAGIDSGYGSGSGSGDGSGDAAGAGAGGKDGTGLTDAEKDKMMSEYERNKRDYEGNEEDGLFGKVSKAYVRNLDKVLIKKKKLDN